MHMTHLGSPPNHKTSEEQHYHNFHHMSYSTTLIPPPVNHTILSPIKHHLTSPSSLQTFPTALPGAPSTNSPQITYLSLSLTDSLPHTSADPNTLTLTTNVHTGKSSPQQQKMHYNHSTWPITTVLIMQYNILMTASKAQANSTFQQAP